jgi:hypothetical protein
VVTKRTNKTIGKIIIYTTEKEGEGEEMTVMDLLPIRTLYRGRSNMEYKCFIRYLQPRFD